MNDNEKIFAGFVVGLTIYLLSLQEKKELTKDELEKLMLDYVGKENYEKAAEIRDIINSMKNNN